MKLVFWEKHEFYLFYCNAQSSIEIDVIVAKTHMTYACKINDNDKV